MIGRMLWGFFHAHGAPLDLVEVTNFQLPEKSPQSIDFPQFRSPLSTGLIEPSLPLWPLMTKILIDQAGRNLFDASAPTATSSSRRWNDRLQRPRMPSAISASDRVQRKNGLMMLREAALNKLHYLASFCLLNTL